MQPLIVEPLEYIALVNKERSPLQKHIGWLLDKTISPSSGNVTNIPKMEKYKTNLVKMRQKRNMFQTKEQDKTKWNGDRQSTWERVQGNDKITKELKRRKHANIQNMHEKLKVSNKELENIKNNQNRDEEYNKWNEESRLK